MSPASAALVYERLDSQSASRRHDIVAAHNDGSAPHVIAQGYGPYVSPNGTRVAYFDPGPHADTLYVVGLRGKHRRAVVKDAYDAGPPRGVAWSNDGRYLISGTGSGAQLVDLRERTSRTIVETNLFGAATFAPDNQRFAFMDADTGRMVTGRVDTRKKQGIGEGIRPLWGTPGLAYEIMGGDIDFPEWTVLLRKEPGGKAQTLLSEAGVDRLESVDWSATSGRLLIAESKTTVSSRAILDDVAQGTITRVPVQFFRIEGLSKDGHSILGERNRNVVSVSPDGAIKVLAHGATHPSWSK